MTTITCTGCWKPITKFGRYATSQRNTRGRAGHASQNYDSACALDQRFHSNHAMSDAQVLLKIARELALIRVCMAEFVALVREASPEPETVTKHDSGQPDNAATHPQTE